MNAWWQATVKYFAILHLLYSILLHIFLYILVVVSAQCISHTNVICATFEYNSNPEISKWQSIQSKQLFRSNSKQNQNQICLLHGVTQRNVDTEVYYTIQNETIKMFYSKKKLYYYGKWNVLLISQWIYLHMNGMQEDIYKCQSM